MAKRSKKPCMKMGCPNLIEYPNRYCPDHTIFKEEEKTEKNQLYDEQVRYGRDRKYTAFYHSREWKKIRELRLRMDHGLCQECKLQSRVTLADTVHHTVEVKEDWSKRLDVANLVSVCNVCHNKLHK